MKPPRANHPARARINSYLPGPLRHRLTAHCAAKGIYESEALRKAVEAYLDGTSDMTLLYRRIDSLNREQHRQRRTLELHAEFVKEFVQLFLKLTSGSADVDKPNFLQRAGDRYRSIIERVTASFSVGTTWVDDLPKEMLSPGLKDAGALVSASPPPAADRQ
jgi:hypothetical protein